MLQEARPLARFVEVAAKPLAHARRQRFAQRLDAIAGQSVIGGAGQYLCEPTLLDNRGKVQRPKLPGGDPVDAFVNELGEVMRCVREGRPSEILGAELAQDAMRICDKQSLSLQRGRPVKF